MRHFEPDLDPLYEQVNAAYRADEAECVRRLLAAAELSAPARERIQAQARALVQAVRSRGHPSAIDAFMHEYQLGSEEGVVLLCLAEALLRIPDAATVDELIRDKLGSADWQRHLGQSESLFVNASTWGLMLGGRMLRPQDAGGILQRLVRRSGEPLVRQAVRQAMRLLGRQFVMGRNIGEALARAAEAPGYRHSFDMLGEAARTAADSERYLAAYREALQAVGEAGAGRGPLASPGVSVKLSALHPRYELAQGERVMAELVPRLRELAELARTHDVGLTVDAEEADRLDLSLAVFQRVALDPALAGWDGLGLAVQAYQKRAWPLLDWLAELAARADRRLMVRLVKGAYWDSEIKRAQERGLNDYPVFTRKLNTDVSYLACARKLLAHGERLYPQFATHNAHTVAAVLELADGREFEFQRLHGMGQALYDQLVDPATGIACRVYAPVGSHRDLLPYLVRRLLENGANTSFVNRLVDERAPLEAVIADPLARAAALEHIPHPRIPRPPELYGEERRNAKGPDLSDAAVLRELAAGVHAACRERWRAAPSIGGRGGAGETAAVYDPADHRRRVGLVTPSRPQHIHRALEIAADAAPGWDRTPVEVRAACLERTADLLEAQLPRFVALCAREAGKTLGDGVAEVREAVDFCRYYAARAREAYAAPRTLPGPSGQHDQLSLHGRGVFVCISPWNFPLAIFTGQVAAALAAGNPVLAKPAEQTPLSAAYAVELMHRAGIPGEVLQFLPGDGAVGAALVQDARVAGVAFTGSTETAWAINRALAARRAPIASLIAETGGQNAMLVDSSALLEQVVVDVLASGFQSAGQRCSALRALFVQADVADRLIEMLAGAMAQLRIGDPADLATDVGPVIDEAALDMLQAHAEHMQHAGRLLHRCALPEECSHGTFFPPQAYELERLDLLEREVFGPIVHVVRYRAGELDAVVDAVNRTGYGLTFGIHSRIERTVERVVQRVRAGNIYVNRGMIGAVPGVQPFGGEGLSGTGPKAGGPHYLLRFATERALSVNTAAAGGDATLLNLDE